MQRRKLFAIAGIIVLVLVIAIGLYTNAVSQTRAAKDLSWRQAQELIHPQLITEDHASRVPVVTRDFVEGIKIAYVIDKATSYDFIMDVDRERWGVAERDLYMSAIENLEEAIEDLVVEVFTAGGKEVNKYITIEETDGYAAARILLPGLRAKVLAELGTPVFAAIPTRDFLIFWHKDFELATAFRNQVREEYSAEQQYRISSSIFKVTEDEIVEYEKSEP